MSKLLEMVSYPSLHVSCYFAYSTLIGNGSRIFQASKEVILSAGAIGSPHILFHSGFGEAQELQAAGITPLVDLPSLGKNLTDHPFLLVDFMAENTEPKYVYTNSLNSLWLSVFQIKVSSLIQHSLKMRWRSGRIRKRVLWLTSRLIISYGVDSRQIRLSMIPVPGQMLLIGNSYWL